MLCHDSNTNSCEVIVRSFYSQIIITISFKPFIYLSIISHSNPYKQFYKTFNRNELKMCDEI